MMTARASLSLLSGWYLTIGAIWLLLSSAAVTYVLLGGVQAILTVMSVAYPVGITLLLINNCAERAIDRGKNPMDIPLDYAIAFWVDALIIGTCIVATYWVWQALERRYFNPTATAIGKLQSYQINLCLSIFLAGFTIYYRATGSNDPQIIVFAILGHFIMLFLQIPALLPSKQVLQGWSEKCNLGVSPSEAPFQDSRYRRAGDRKFWLQDLGLNDKSPALLAIAINLGMAVVIWLAIASRYVNNRYELMRIIATLALGTSLILIYGAIAHLSLFINFKQRNVALVGILGATMCLPIAVAFIMTGGKTATGIAGILLLFSPFAAAGIVNLSGMTIFAAFAAQLAIFGVLTYSLERKLQIIGRSQTKELLDPIRG